MVLIYFPIHISHVIFAWASTPSQISQPSALQYTVCQLSPPVTESECNITHLNCFWWQHNTRPNNWFFNLINAFTQTFLLFRFIISLILFIYYFYSCVSILQLYVFIYFCNSYKHLLLNFKYLFLLWLVFSILFIYFLLLIYSRNLFLLGIYFGNIFLIYSL